MAEKPLKYLSRYKPINFPGCGSQGSLSVSINRYTSGDVQSANQYRRAAYNDLIDFLLKRTSLTQRYKDGANGAGDHYYSEATGFLLADDLKPVSFHYCPLSYIRDAFQGKGTPRRFSLVLKVCDYYLQHANMQLSRLGWGAKVTQLQEYVDYYIGMDCNGFVGAYLEENFPGTGIKNNIDIDSLGSTFGKGGASTGARFTAIEDPRQIKSRAILVRRRVSGGSRHIALVDDVSGVATSKQAQLKLAESRGGDGLSSRTVTFKKIKKDGDGRQWKMGTKLYDAALRIN